MPRSNDSPSTVTGSTKTSTSLMRIPIPDRVAAAVTVGHLTRSSVANLGHAVFSTAKSLLRPKPRRYLQFGSWTYALKILLSSNCFLVIIFAWSFQLSPAFIYSFPLLPPVFLAFFLFIFSFSFTLPNHFLRLHSDMLLGFCLYIQLIC